MNYWIIASLILSFISPIIYSKSIFAHKSKPHKVTRLIVWLASIVSILAVFHTNSLSGEIFATIFLVRATYLLILAGIYGVGGSSSLDQLCLVLGILALVVYAVTGNGFLAISLAILSDLIGYVPTFVKTWRDPTSENATFFIIEGAASLFGALAVRQFSVAIVLPVYFMLCSGTVVVLIYHKKLTTLFKTHGSTTLDAPQ